MGRAARGSGDAERIGVNRATGEVGTVEAMSDEGRSPELPHAHTAAPAEELTAEEIRVLREVAAERSGVGLSGRLSQQFEQHERRASRSARICLALIPLLSFGTAPLWQAMLAGTPPQMFPLLLALELGVVAPLSLLIAWIQWRHVDSDWGELMLMGGFLFVVGCVEWIRYRGDAVGHVIEPLLSVVIPVAVITLARLRLRRCAVFVVGYLGIFLGVGLLMPGDATPLNGQEWLIEGLLLGVALLTAAGIRLASRRQWAAGRLLAMMAFRDPLTGLGNRRALEDRYDLASRAVSRGQQRGLFFALLDMDHFKDINDHYGHEYGDGVLAELGVVLGQFARRSLDTAARLGGDEFALLLYDCDVEHGRARLAELLQAIRDLQIEHRANHTAIVTGSAGGVAISPGRPMSEAYLAADRCLYRAKHAGRNGLVVEDLKQQPFDPG